MSGWTIKAPQPDYSGLSAGVQFRDGVGWTDNEAAVAYFRETGYDVTKGTAGSRSALAEVPLSIDPAITRQPPSRDAAVEKNADGPMSDAFLPPVGAGDGRDPHGPQVVSPGLHGVNPSIIVPGPVSSDPAVQEASESAVTVEVLVEGTPVDEANSVASDATPGGPLELSDPASVGEGPDAAEGEWTKERLLKLAEERGLDVNRRNGVAKLREQLGV